MRGIHNSLPKRTTLAVVLLAFAAALGVQAQQWQTYSYPADGFRAAFPSEPQFSKRDVPTDKGSFELRAYLAERTPDQVLDGAQQGAIDNVKAHLVSGKKITFGVYPGREFEADNDTMHFYARIYLVGSTLYQTLIASPLGTPYPSATTFLNSFQLIPRVSGAGSGVATP
jgi:hypothetical protein